MTNVRRRLARVLEAESGANDPIAVALTIGLIQWVEDRSYGLPDLILLVARQLSLGLVVGLAVGAAAAWTLARLPGLAVQFAPVYTLAAGAIGFGLADVAGGSGFLAVYIVGLFIGNTATPLRRYLVSFHAGLAFLAQVGLFIVLGLFVFPRQFGPVILPGLAVVAVLLFVARPASRLARRRPSRASTARADVPRLGRPARRGPDRPRDISTGSGAPGEQDDLQRRVLRRRRVGAVQGPTLEPLARALS